MAELFVAYNILLRKQKYFFDIYLVLIANGVVYPQPPAVQRISYLKNLFVFPSSGPAL